MNRPFLTAEWLHLILANYPVSADMLSPWLIDGLEPDRFDGRCWVSLVGFQFRRTRVLGVGWPGFRDFPEWNLRAYVRYHDQRGVIFIREYVRSRLIAWLARCLYNEPYDVASISDDVSPNGSGAAIRYTFVSGGVTHELAARTTGRGINPTPASDLEFFTDQSWGFGRTRRGAMQRYAVNHPLWPIERVHDCDIRVDWQALYVPAWSALTSAEPESVLYAAGSEVAVFPATRFAKSTGSVGI